jgi:hypothetical protein
LQARRQVRGLADDRLLLSGARADEIADHDEPGSDADADSQGNAGDRIQFRRRFDQRKPGLHGAFGVVFVRLGIAEIGQDPVAHIFGDEAAGLGDEVFAEPMIGADDLAHILGIEPRRQRGRADEVDEHYGQLPPLRESSSRSRLGRRGHFRDRGRRGRRRGERPDRQQ